MKKYRAICIAVAAVFFWLAGWQIQLAVQDPQSPMMWTKISLAMFVASMGNALIRMASPRL